MLVTTSFVFAALLAAYNGNQHIEATPIRCHERRDPQFGTGGYPNYGMKPTTANVPTQTITTTSKTQQVNQNQQNVQPAAGGGVGSNTNYTTPNSGGQGGGGGGGGILSPGFSWSGHVTNYQSSDGTGACNYKNMQPKGMLRSGIGGTQWHGSLACGSCVRVEPSQGKSIDVYIVNVTEDGDGLDLELASMIAMKGSTGGAIPSKLTVIKCPFSEPIQVEVTAPQALQMTIGRTTVPVMKAEISTGNGGWQEMRKIDPYHWAPSGGAGGMGGSFSLRLTGSNGQTIVQTGLTASAGGVQTGSTNF